MNHNPEHEQIENKSPQPQVDYALIADRLQDGVQQNIALTSEAEKSMMPKSKPR